jgi:hypothetical protein
MKTQEHAGSMLSMKKTVKDLLVIPKEIKVVPLTPLDHPAEDDGACGRKLSKR